MPVLDDERHELFAQNLFQFPEQTQEENYLAAGFTCKKRNAKSGASKLLKSTPTISYRVKELQEEVASEKIADVTERKEILTDILRESIVGNYITATGDIDLPSVRRGYCNGVAEYVEITRLDGSINRKIKVNNRVTAIQELNKMDNAYETPSLNLVHRVERVNIVRSKP